MKNTQKGYVVPLLVTIIALLAVGWGSQVYRQDKEAEMQKRIDAAIEESNAMTAAERAESRSEATGAVKVNSETGAKVASNIVWSFPISRQLPESDIEKKVVVTIDGKTYDTGYRGGFCGSEVATSQLLEGQLAAARCSNGDTGIEFAVRKDGSNYIITVADFVYKNKTIDESDEWRLNARKVADINVSTQTITPVITWSYVRGTLRGETESLTRVYVTIGVIKYDTEFQSVGCGTEIAKSELQAGQLSATLCGMYAGSGNVLAVHREGTGYKIVINDVDEAPNGGIGRRGEPKILMSIK